VLKQLPPLKQENQNQFLVLGVQMALAHIFKHGARQSMLDKVPLVVGALQNAQDRPVLQRLYACKLSQRLGSHLSFPLELTLLQHEVSAS
jgi:hypothetical protein